MSLNKIAPQQTLPSGLIVHISRWGMKEMMEMSEASEQRRTQMLDGLFAGCVVVDDPNQVYGAGLPKPKSTGSRW